MRNYSTKTDPSLADKPLVWDVANSQWVQVPLSSILTLFENSSALFDGMLKEPTTQRLIATEGFTVQVTDGTEDIHLLLTPASTLTAGTITLPISPGVRDKQLVTVTTTEEITALTVAGNGALLSGEPSTILAGGYFTMKYDMQTNTWYRVG